MEPDRQPLSDDQRDRLYFRRIRPDLLDDRERSFTPTAVLVAGQPGAGRSCAAARVQTRLASTAGASVLISGDTLRAYHPHGAVGPSATSNDEAGVRDVLSHWYARLAVEAIARSVNIVFETRLREPQAAVELAHRLKGAGYAFEAVLLATDRDSSRQAALARYDIGRAADGVARLAPAIHHDAAYAQLRVSLARLEAERAVDRLQLLARDGRQLYANQTDGGRWLREPTAVAALDGFRERRLTARELADSVLRWQTLAARLGADADLPRELASQLLAWRDEAVDRAAHDPEARRILTRAQEAMAFRTMNRFAFAHAYPQHAKAVERLDEAIRYAEETFGLAADRERFIAQARERIAERIAEGQLVKPERETKPPGAKTR